MLGLPVTGLHSISDGLSEKNTTQFIKLTAGSHKDVGRFHFIELFSHGFALLHSGRSIYKFDTLKFGV